MDAYANALLDEAPVKAVVMDVDINMKSIQLMKSEYFLRKDPECMLIGGAANPMLPLREHKIMGNGAFIQLIEEKTGVAAKILGKPGQDLVDYLLEKYEIEDPSRVLLIGDSISSDATFGKASGFQTLIVMTGATGPEHLDTCDPSICPEYNAKGLCDFVNFCE